MMTISPFEQLGGEEVLTEIIDDFVERVTGDMMIGFFFRGVDIDRLKQREISFAETHLGGRNAYNGRPLAVAHGAHQIMGGQFNRRLIILEQTLKDHKVDPKVIDLWLEHNEQLRSHITRDAPGECIGAAPKEKG